tara:strand:- start:982 stop:1425 length:444 start_codon:yes stop_codon:yes gene_type:complete
MRYKFSNLISAIKRLLRYFIVFLVVIFIYPFSDIAFSNELDLTAAQSSVGIRFSKVFCEAKMDGLSTDSASEFALNNTYLKFVDFPDDQKFIDDLWLFTIHQIKEDCGEVLFSNDEKELKAFFNEEERIAINRDLYLPKFEESSNSN